MRQKQETTKTTEQHKQHKFASYIVSQKLYIHHRNTTFKRLLKTYNVLWYTSMIIL